MGASFGVARPRPLQPHGKGQHPHSATVGLETSRSSHRCRYRFRSAGACVWGASTRPDRSTLRLQSCCCIGAAFAWRWLQLRAGRGSPDLSRSRNGAVLACSDAHAHVWIVRGVPPRLVWRALSQSILLAGGALPTSPPSPDVPRRWATEWRMWTRQPCWWTWQVCVCVGVGVGGWVGGGGGGGLGVSEHAAPDACACAPQPSSATVPSSGPPWRPFLA